MEKCATITNGPKTEVLSEKKHVVKLPVEALNEINRLAGDNEYLQKKEFKNYLKKQQGLKSNEKFNSNNAAIYIGTDGAIAKNSNIYVNNYMGKNKAGETLYSVYTSRGKKQIVLGKNIKLINRKNNQFITDNKSNAQKDISKEVIK